MKNAHNSNSWRETQSVNSSPSADMICSLLQTVHPHSCAVKCDNRQHVYAHGCWDILRWNTTKCMWFLHDAVWLILSCKMFPLTLDEVMSMDQDLLKIILENHILKNKIVLGQLYNGQHLETIAGKLLRVFIYRTVGFFFLLGHLTLHASALTSGHQASCLWDATSTFNSYVVSAGCVHWEFLSGKRQ